MPIAADYGRGLMFSAAKVLKRISSIHCYHCQKRGRNGCPAKYIKLSVLEKKVEEEFKKLEFSDTFIDAVIKKAKGIVEQSRKEASSVTQRIINQKSALETKRHRLEDILIDGSIDRETFKRRHEEIQKQILNLDNEVANSDAKGKMDIDLIEEVLAFAWNIHQTYIEAPQFLKRHYLRFFFEQIVMKDKKIYKVVPTPIFKVLRNRHEIIITNPQLPRQDSNLQPSS